MSRNRLSGVTLVLVAACLAVVLGPSPVQAAGSLHGRAVITVPPANNTYSACQGSRGRRTACRAARPEMPVPSPAHALAIGVYGPMQAAPRPYPFPDITTLTGTVYDSVLNDTIMAQPWWGDIDMAWVSGRQLGARAGSVRGQLGLPEPAPSSCYASHAAPSCMRGHTPHRVLPAFVTASMQCTERHAAGRGILRL